MLETANKCEITSYFERMSRPHGFDVADQLCHMKGAGGAALQKEHSLIIAAWRLTVHSTLALQLPNLWLGQGPRGRDGVLVLNAGRSTLLLIILYHMSRHLGNACPSLPGL